MEPPEACYFIMIDSTVSAAGNHVLIKYEFTAAILAFQNAGILINLSTCQIGHHLFFCLLYLKD